MQGRSEMYICTRLPELVYCASIAEWAAYEEYLYTIFKADLIDDQPYFMGKPVRVRDAAIFIDGKEKEFWHFIYKEDAGTGERLPDLYRSERLVWVRAFLEIWHNCGDCSITGCTGIKIWQEYKKGKPRAYLYLDEESFIVILEEKKTFWYLISAFYVDPTYAPLLRRHYARYKKQGGAS